MSRKIIKEKINIEDIKDKNIFDLTREEFHDYFERNIRYKMNGLIRFMWKLNEELLANNMFFLIFIFIPFGIISAILLNSNIGPRMEAYEKIHPDGYSIIILSLIIISVIIGIFSFKILAKIVFDKPAKKIIFKELGFEYYNGLLYSYDFEHIAKHLSKSFFRIDGMLRGKYKGRSLDIIDCAEGGLLIRFLLRQK